MDVVLGFIFLFASQVFLSFLALFAEHDIIEQIRRLLRNGVPDFEAGFRPIIYLAAMCAIYKLSEKLKLPKWAFWSATALSLVLVAYCHSWLYPVG